MRKALPDLAVFAGAVGPLALVLSRLDIVAFDSDRAPRTLLVWLALSIMVGILVGNAVAISRTRWIMTVGVGALLVSLAAIGEPAWVTVAVLVGVAGCTAVALSAVVSAQRIIGDAGSAAAGIATAGGVGAIVGLAVSTWSPVDDWANSIAVSGAICLAVGAFTVLQPSPTANDGAVDQRRARRDIDGRPVADIVRRPLRWHAVLVVGMWPLMAEQIRSDSVVSVRYPQLAIGLGALVAIIGGGLGHLFDSRRVDSTSRRVQVVHVATTLGGVAALAATTSHTLIGSVVGWGIAVGSLCVGWVHAALAVASDPDPLGRAVAVGRSWGTVAIASAFGLILSAIAEPEHHTWWITVIALVCTHQSVRRLRRMKVDDVEDAEQTAVRGRVSARRNDRTLLDVDRLDSGYGDLRVLFSVDMVVERGEVVALLGPNGAGKTTLLRTIAGLHPTWGGRVQFGGVDLAGLDAAGRVGAGLMLVSPESAIARTLTVDDNLRLFSHMLSPGDARAARQRVYDAFPRLRERLRQTASTLSGGERQMLALSRALMLRPELLLIDELTLGLSPQAVADLGPSIRALNDEGTALVIVEQSTAVALSLASRALVLERGALTADFPAQRLRERPDLMRQIHLEGIQSVVEIGATS